MLLVKLNFIHSYKETLENINFKISGPEFSGKISYTMPDW